MDCTEFELILDDFLSGELAADERMSATAHLSTCPDCRHLISVARGDLDLAPVETESSLAASILAKTGTDPCRKARSQLCDLVDGELDPTASRILASHLEHCRRCSALFVALTEVAALLPEFAEIQPDHSFLKDTLAFTTAPAEEIVHAPSMLRTLADKLFQRPRFSWEAAYVGTLIIVTLLGGAPSWPTASQTDTVLASLKIDTALAEQMGERTYRRWLGEVMIDTQRRIEAGHRSVKKGVDDSLLYLDGEIERIVGFASELYESGHRLARLDWSKKVDTPTSDKARADSSKEN